MTTVGIRALKQNASAVVAQAVAGTPVTITDRGRPVALIPALPGSPLRRLLDSGRARPARRRLLDLEPPEPGTPLSPTLRVMRGDERY